MKRILIFLLVMVIIVSLAGCQGATVPEQAPTEQTSAEQSSAEQSSAEQSSAANTDPIKIGHLDYWTGPFGHLGPLFDASLFFTLQYINEDPPLGRTVELINEDIGTLGEGTVARKLIEQDGVDILLNVAGEYNSYRDWLLEYIAANNGPLLPSIHAGSVEQSRGGVAAEPIFRGQPMDTDQALTAALHLFDKGATKIVVIAVEREEMQGQQDAAAAACTHLGMQVLDTIDIIPESPSYAAEATKVAAHNPDGIIIFGAGEDAGTLVKNLSEAGVKAMIVGETNFTAEEFLKTATLEAIQQQVFVKCATYGITDSPAVDFYNKEWADSKNAKYLEDIDNDIANTYVTSAYDVVTATCLAIELAGSTDADAWTEAMYKVTMAPGKKVYTYAEGMAALKAGEEIDYEGITGSVDYTETGVVSAIYMIQDWSTGKLVNDTIIDGLRLLKLSEELAAAK